MSVAKVFGTEKWLVFVVSLPTANTALRMRVWRGLKALGSAILRDGVYLLPAGRGLRQSLKVFGEEIRHAGGDAFLLNVSTSASEARQDFRAMFDRGEDYRRLSEGALAFREDFRALDAAAARRRLKQLRREMEGIAVVDYFPGLAKLDAEELLAQVENDYMASLTPGEPRGGNGAVQLRNRADFQARLWATRRHLWVDRMASAWLIRRSIDPEARFIWLEKPEDCPPEAVGFDFDGAQFTHVGGKVTFEALLASFALDADPSLCRLGTLVHCLDVGGIPVAEAAGVEMLLNGARQDCADDDELLVEAGRIFDRLYRHYRQEDTHE